MAKATDWDGSNNISRNGLGQWGYQSLLKSRKGRYYILTRSLYEKVQPISEWITEEDAARWLLLNEHPLPEDLKQYEDAVVE